MLMYSFDFIAEERRAAEQEFRRRVKELWGSFSLFEKMHDYNVRRAQLLNELYLVYPEMQLQYADIEESFRSRLAGYEWNLCFEAPVVHYRILPNELVFDIDGGNGDGDRTRVKETVRGVALTLKSLGAQQFIGFSGNRGYHIHVLLAPAKGRVEDFVQARGVKELRNCIFEWVLSLLKARSVDISLIDTGVMIASEHTIRSFYSFNAKGRRWKRAVFGESYGFWKLTREVYERAMEIMREKERKRLLEWILQNEEEDKGEKGEKGKKRDWKWIERVLRDAEKVQDGRKRLLIHAIIPYLVTVKGLGDVETEERCREWLERTGVDYARYRSLVRSEIRAVRRKRLWPMRIEKFRERYQDIRI